MRVESARGNALGLTSAIAWFDEGRGFAESGSSSSVLCVGGELTSRDPCSSIDGM